MVPPKLTAYAIRFVPTSIGSSCNVEGTVQTTKHGMRHLTRSSPLRLKRELQLGSDECSFQPCVAPLWQLLPAYFPLSQPFMDCCNYLRKRLDVKSIAAALDKTGPPCFQTIIIR